MATARLELPPKLIPVFTGPARYRGAYGGRGSAKTRSFAKMAAVKGYQLALAGKRGLIVGAREFMNSLDDSSFAEIREAILSEPWLAAHYEIGEKYIRTKCRRINFAFVGLRRSLDSIKSKARIHLIWVDEAESVSETAWNKAIPTVREHDSEVWVTWNPENENSPTNQRFRINAPEGAKIVELNWRDNPWFPEVLREEMERDRRRDPEMHQHIWEGGYLTNSEARVFRNWRVEEFDTPKDAVFRFGADWGFAVDPTVLVRCYVDGRTLYVDQEAWAVGCEIDKTPALFDRIEGSRKWTITADSARPETVSYMRRQGFKIIPAIKGAGSVEDGVEFLKSYDIVVHPRCKHVADELARYSYKQDPQTDEILPVLEDKNNQTIDALRYALEALRRSGARPVEPEQKPVDRYARRRPSGSTSWL